MKIIAYKANNKRLIQDTITILKKGGLIVSPSDTVYGLLGDATSDLAVGKSIEFKSRPAGKAISVFVSSLKMLQEYVEVSEKQKSLLNQFLPGPFTIILPAKHKTSLLLESEDGTLGVRIPNYDFIIKLVSEYGKPITATSANLSGDNPHYSVESLMNSLSEKKKELIDLIIDSGKLPRYKPSTVIDLTTSELKIIRQGDISVGKQNHFFSYSSEETKAIAKNIYQQIIKKINNQPLFIVLEGELGVGKTIFVKGLAEELKIENIISPTFVVSYEYPLVKKPFDKFVHYDLYNIKELPELEHLGIEEYLKGNNVIAFEWGEKMGNLLERLKSKGKVVYIKMKYLNEIKREIIVNY